MRTPPRPLSLIALTTALTIGLTGPAPAWAAAPGDGDTELRGAAAAALQVRHAVPVDRATLLPPHAASRHRWPVKKRVAHTVAHNAPASTATKAQRLKSAKIVQDLTRSTISATVVLRAAPASATDSNVLVALGQVSADGRMCTSLEDSSVYWQAYGVNGASAPGLLRNGATMKLLHFPSPSAGKDRFDCAFAETWSYPADDPTSFDTYLDGRSTVRLKPKYDKPTLKVKAPKKKRALVNRWQKVRVRVRNTNPRVAAPGVKVRVKGKAVKTKTARLGRLRPGGQKTVKVRFRVQRGHRHQARIVVASGSLTTARKLRLR